MLQRPAVTSRHGKMLCSQFMKVATLLQPTGCWGSTHPRVLL